ncbi:hypothetical protein KCP77_24770 (plasmid) [Salmonella enterica subsp. enterica]|nr:hypothetical protein KCP77_24770 [Salmonella enterica subsp. enterica]
MTLCAMRLNILFLPSAEPRGGDRREEHDHGSAFRDRVFRFLQVHHFVTLPSFPPASRTGLRY